MPDTLLQVGGLRIRRDDTGRLPADATPFEVVGDFERRKIIEQLEQSNWSQTEAAEALRIPLFRHSIRRSELNIDMRRARGGGQA